MVEYVGEYAVSVLISFVVVASDELSLRWDEWGSYFANLAPPNSQQLWPGQ